MFSLLSSHQKCQAVLLDPHRRSLACHQLKPLVLLVLSSHHHRLAIRDSIRQSEMQVGMTIVRDQIHGLVSKNDAVIIVIEANGVAREAVCQCSSQFVSGSIVRVHVCVRGTASTNPLL